MEQVQQTTRTINGAIMPSRKAAEEAVLKTLAYYDIFSYPLTRTEIQTFLSIPVKEDMLASVLDDLVCRQLVFLFDGFYLLQNKPSFINRRIEGNEKAVALLKKAGRIGRFLYQFPFVRSVGVSGSLSKGFAGPDADIDFFIITKPGRLWTARTLMHLYKKLTFLTGQQHYHCMNYYIDEAAYHLESQNIFTAIEIKTLLPVCGEKEMKAFFAANQWTQDWLPACNYREALNQSPRSSWLKRLGEWFYGRRVGDRMENFLFSVTSRRWKKKEQRLAKNYKGVTMGLETNLHFAKSNPGGFEKKVLMMYDERVTALLQKNSAHSFISNVSV